MKQIPLALGPEGNPRFDDYVIGANGAALEHLRALAFGAPPVYLWGPPGGGKTHLLKALASEWQSEGSLVGWFDAARPEPWPTDPVWSLIVLDDCDCFDAGQQQAAFRLFVEAQGAAVPIAAAGRVPPVDLGVRDDLRTRLGWGHVFALEPLPEDAARAVLRREADRRGIVLSDEVLDHLLRRFARDLKHLMGLLDRLDGFSLARQRTVTVPLLKQMLIEEGL